MTDFPTRYFDERRIENEQKFLGKNHVPIIIAYENRAGRKVNAFEVSTEKQLKRVTKKIIN